LFQIYKENEGVFLIYQTQKLFIANLRFLLIHTFYTLYSQVLHASFPIKVAQMPAGTDKNERE